MNSQYPHQKAKVIQRSKLHETPKIINSSSSNKYKNKTENFADC